MSINITSNKDEVTVVIFDAEKITNEIKYIKFEDWNGYSVPYTEV